jgi:hypothetical protein
MQLRKLTRKIRLRQNVAKRNHLLKLIAPEMNQMPSEASAINIDSTALMDNQLLLRLRHQSNLSSIQCNIVPRINPPTSRLAPHQGHRKESSADAERGKATQLL